MKNERGRWLGLWAVTVVMAGWLGSKLRNDDAPGEAAALVASADSGAASRRRGEEAWLAAQGRGTAERGASADELRELMRDELARAEARRQGGAGPLAADVEEAGVDANADERGDDRDVSSEVGVDSAAPPPSREERAQRVSDALAVVRGAMASGQWSGEERQRFAAAAQRLPAAELFEVTRQLNIAINRGQVVISDGRPPYGPLAMLP